MLKATNTTTTTVLPNGVIPINLKKNTFPYVTLNNNAITINKAGVYQIMANFNITANATIGNVGLYNNGTLIQETNVSIDTANGDEYQLVINDIETVSATLPNTTKVVLTFQTVDGFILDIANVSIIELR